MGNIDSTQHGGDPASVTQDASPSVLTSDPGNAVSTTKNTKKRNNAVSVEETVSDKTTPPADPVVPVPPTDPNAPLTPAEPNAPLTPAEPEGNAVDNEGGDVGGNTVGNEDGDVGGNVGGNEDGDAGGNNESANDDKKKQECEQLLKPSPDIQKIEEAPGFFSWLGNWFSYDYWQETEEEKKKHDCETILGKKTNNDERGGKNMSGEADAEETIVREGANAPPPKEDLLRAQGGGRRHTHKNRTSRRKTHKNRE